MQGKPCCTRMGYSKVKRTYYTKLNDRIEKIEYFDDDGKLTYNNEVGYAFACYEYDNLEWGNGDYYLLLWMNQEI